MFGTWMRIAVTWWKKCEFSFVLYDMERCFAVKGAWNLCKECDIWCFNRRKDTNKGLTCIDWNYQMLLFKIQKATNDIAIRSLWLSGEMPMCACNLLYDWISVDCVYLLIFKNLEPRRLEKSTGDSREGKICWVF